MAGRSEADAVSIRNALAEKAAAAVEAAGEREGRWPANDVY